MKHNGKWHKFAKNVTRELKENKVSYFVYIGLRLLVLIVMILQIFNKNYENVFLCILTLLLLLLPSIVQATFKVEIPSLFEIIIFSFIFAAEILGEISAFYIIFPHWDTVLHTLNGFLCAAIGFSLVDIMNQQKKEKMKFELSPLYLAIVAFCFSMTIGVVWEFFEFSMDMLFGLDMQKDTIVHTISSVMLDPQKGNHYITIRNITSTAVNGVDLGLGGYLDIGLIDTMEDLLVNFIGALVFSILGYVYIKKRDAKGIVEGLVLEPWKKEKNTD